MAWLNATVRHDRQQFSVTVLANSTSYNVSVLQKEKLNLFRSDSLSFFSFSFVQIFTKSSLQVFSIALATLKKIEKLHLNIKLVDVVFIKTLALECSWLCFYSP